LLRLLTGELRQGALEGGHVEAFAKARDLPASDVRRAVMLAGNLGAVASGDLSSFKVELFRRSSRCWPRRRQTSMTRWRSWARPSFEYKLDGIPDSGAQKRRAGTNLLAHAERHHAELPAVVDISTIMDMSEVILDGEAIVLSADKRPVRFQETMKGLGFRCPILL